jgi:flagellar hook-associated protein 3 FlgL
MDLRVDYQTLINRVLFSTRQQTDRLGRLQQQATTGKKLQAPSDDPVAAVKILAGHAQVNRLDTSLANLGQARTVLDLGVSALREAGSIFSKAASPRKSTGCWIGSLPWPTPSTTTSTCSVARLPRRLRLS